MILPGFCSDHSPIVFDFDFSKFTRGRGFWKFNSSLLKDIEYVKKVKDTIKETTCKYAIINGETNFFERANNDELSDFLESQTPESLQSLDIILNPQQFLDVLLLEVRRITIQYSATKKRERAAYEQLLLHNIEILTFELNMSNENTFTAISEQLQLKKADLETVYAHKAQGAYIRARTKYKVEGEKPTRLFCSLEKHNLVQKYIPQLKVVNDGIEETIQDQKKIEEEIYSYYGNLFTNRDQDMNINTIENFLGPESSTTCPKLESKNVENKLRLKLCQAQV